MIFTEILVILGTIFENEASTMWELFSLRNLGYVVFSQFWSFSQIAT